MQEKIINVIDPKVINKLCAGLSSAGFNSGDIEEILIQLGGAMSDMLNEKESNEEGIAKVEDECIRLSNGFSFRLYDDDPEEVVDEINEATALKVAEARCAARKLTEARTVVEVEREIEDLKSALGECRAWCGETPRNEAEKQAIQEASDAADKLLKQHDYAQPEPQKTEKYPKGTTHIHKDGDVIYRQTGDGPGEWMFASRKPDGGWDDWCATARQAHGDPNNTIDSAVQSGHLIPLPPEPQEAVTAGELEEIGDAVEQAIRSWSFGTTQEHDAMKLLSLLALNARETKEAIDDLVDTVAAEAIAAARRILPDAPAQPENPSQQQDRIVLTKTADLEQEDIFSEDDPTGTDKYYEEARKRKETADAYKVDIKSCARCGQDHNQLEFKELTNPHNEYTKWAMCPVIHEPIMLKIIKE